MPKASATAFPMATDADQPPQVDLLALFKVFFLIGLTSLGGGASAHIHHAIVQERGWLDDQQMLEGMTLARIIPGTNVSNLAAFVGSRLAGYRGAAIAVCGVVLPGTFIMLGLAFAFVKLALGGLPVLPRLHGLAAGAVGIMVSLVLDAIRPAARSRGGLLFAAAAFLGVGVAEINVLAVLVVLVPLASFFNRTPAAP